MSDIKNKNTFAKMLTKLRKENGYTQYTLAEKLGFSRGLISNYEQGRREPDYDTLRTIADFFNVSLDYLIGKTNSNKLNTDDKIKNAVSEDPELYEFTKQMLERESLKLLFKQTKDMDDRDIRQILTIIKAIEDAEAAEDDL